LLSLLIIGGIGIYTFRQRQLTNQALLQQLLRQQHPSLLSIGFYHGCAIRADATLACWSTNDESSIVPPPDGTFRHVSVSSSLEPGYACAISTDHELRCWGKGLKRQPPRGQFIDVDLADTSVNACAVRGNGTVVCWQNKPGAEVDNPPLGESIIHVLSMNDLTCALHTDSSFNCSPPEKSDLHPSAAENTMVKDVSSAASHTCAIRLDGTVACWGQNFNGQATPPQGTFTSIRATQTHTCGIRTDSTLACWGTDHWGLTTPPAGTFVAVDAGVWHNCAIPTTGPLVCWGESYAEQRPFWSLPAGPFKVSSP
jgi:alpha-tubulin suppressor-like RCC1 family protein